MLSSMFETLCDLLERRIPGLVAIYAFGSRVRGDAQRDSDFDLAVLGPSRRSTRRSVGSSKKSSRSRRARMSISSIFAALRLSCGCRF